MQKKTTALVILMLVVAGGLISALEVGDEPAVSVRSGELRSTPGFLSSINGRVEYGESVAILEFRGDWIRVRASDTGSEGWLHNSAVAEKATLRLEKSDDTTSGATTREIALAGRGFNEKVEAEYKSEKNLDFTVVDEMEENEIAVDRLAEFLGEGDLSVDEGGER